MSQLVNILGIKISRVAKEEAVKEIERLIATDKSNLVVTPNPEMIMLAQQDSRLKEIINSARLALPDGTGVVWAADFLNNSLIERVAGIEVVEELLARGVKQEYVFYFLGGAPGVAKQAKQQVKATYPELTIYTHHGYLDKSAEKEVIAELNSLSVDILLVGMGSPLQEKWLSTYLNQLTIGVGIGVGGTFDVLAGQKKRAPAVFQLLGLEWLYRLYQEPSRWRRLGRLGQFVFAVIKQKLKLHR